MAESKKSSAVLKKFIKELEELKEKKRVLEENEQRHITPNKSNKKTKSSKKSASGKNTKQSLITKKKKLVPVTKKLALKKPRLKKVSVPKIIKRKKINAPKPKAEPKDLVKTPEEEAAAESITDEEIQNFQVGKANMEQLINRVCEILATSQTEGMFQSEVWRRLRLTVRDGFRLALKLEWLGIISREKVLEKGRWTYKLLLKRTPISTRSIVASPCLTCPVEQKCTPDGEVSPYTCELIRDWVIIEAKGSRKKE